MAKKKVENIQIGDKVWVVTEEFNIEEKKVFEIIDARDSDGKPLTKYKLMANFCGGVERSKFHTKRSLAELYVKRLTCDLKYQVGDIVIVNSRRRVYLGRVHSWKNDSTHPYNVVCLGGSYSYNHDGNYSEDNLTKVRDDFIEDFEDIKDIQAELSDMEQSYRDKKKELYNRYDKLTKAIKTNFIRSENNIFVSKMKKLRYQNTFEKRRDD